MYKRQVLSVVTGIFGILARVLGAVLVPVLAIVSPFLEFLGQLFAAVLPYVEQLADALLQNLAPILEGIGGAVESVTGALSGLLGLGGVDRVSLGEIEVGGTIRTVFENEEGELVTDAGGGWIVPIAEDTGITPEELERFRTASEAKVDEAQEVLAEEPPIPVDIPVAPTLVLTEGEVESGFDATILDDTQANLDALDTEAATNATSEAFAKVLDLDIVISTISVQLESLWTDTVIQEGTAAFSTMSDAAVEIVNTLVQNIETSFVRVWDNIIDDFETRRPILTLGGIEIETTSVLAEFFYEGLTALRSDGRLYEFVG